MKKFFRFFSLALLAGSLTFVACGKDDEEEEDNTNVTPTPAATSVKIAFQSKSYTMGFSSCLYNAEKDLFAFKCAQSATKVNDEYLMNNPYLELNGSWDKDPTDPIIDDDAIGLFVDDDHVSALEQKFNKKNYPDWTFWELTDLDKYKCEFDANKMTLNAYMAMMMFNEYDFEFNQPEDSDFDAYVDTDPNALKKMVLTVENMSFQNTNSK